MPSICFPILEREQRPGVPNDPFERIDAEAQAIIRNAASFFEGQVETPLAVPSEGERLALRRAMARFLIDSGIASAQGWI